MLGVPIKFTKSIDDKIQITINQTIESVIYGEEKKIHFDDSANFFPLFSATTQYIAIQRTQFNLAIYVLTMRKNELRTLLFQYVSIPEQW